MNTTRRDFIRTSSLAAAGLAAGSSLLPQMASAAEESAVPAINLGLASYSLRKFSQAETITMTAQAGLKYGCFKSFHLALDASAEQCAAAAKACTDGGITLYGVGVIYCRSEDAVVQAFDYAKAAGVDTIVGVAGPDLLPLVEKKVKETDIRFAIHNHGPGDKLYPTAEVTMKTIGKYDPRIGLCIDIGHSLRAGEDPAEAIRKYPERVHDLHLKDVNQAAPSGRGCTCGEGVLDLKSVIQALLDIKFARVAAFEYEADASAPMAGLTKSVDHVKKIIDDLTS